MMHFYDILVTLTCTYLKKEKYWCSDICVGYSL